MEGIPRRIQKSLASYPTWIGILIFGSIWGALECTVGGALRLGFGPFFKSQLHMCPCPLLMFAFGFPVMAAALAIYKKPAMLLGIGLVAASFSFLVIPIQNVPAFTTPLTTYPLINPAIAIVLSSVIFGFVASLVARKVPLSTLTLAGIGALSAMLSSIAFVYTVVGLGAPILEATGLSGQLAFIATNGTAFTAMSAATLPFGYLAGVKIDLALSHWIRVKPWLYRAGPIAVLILCWGASITVTAAGL